MTALAIAAVGEVVTGLLLLAVPELVARLLLGSDPGPTGVMVARVTGAALIGLGVACWPRRAPGRASPGLIGMLSYTALVALYLGALGATGRATGILLWPAVAIHGVLAVLFVSRISRGPR